MLCNFFFFFFWGGGGGQTKCIMGNVEMANGQEKKGYVVSVIALVFVSVSSSVSFVQRTGLVKPADDVHMVSGYTVAPTAYFYIYCFPNLLKR